MKTWLDTMNTCDRSGAVLYLSPKVRLTKGQVIVHPEFGVGFVNAMVGVQKVQAIFRDNLPRVLVHGRGDTEQELAGEPVGLDELERLLRTWR